MKAVKIDEKEYYLKSSFSEFTKREFLKVAFVRSKNLEEMTVQEYHAARIQLFTVLSNVPFRKVEKITSEQWADILPHLNFCFDAPDFKATPLKSFRLGIRTYHAPLGLLDKSSFGEMASADNSFIKANTNSLPAFAHLAATLYRPKRRFLFFYKLSEKWNGDIREQFNMTRIKSREKKFEKLPLHVLVGVFMYYQSFRENRLMKFKLLFSGSSTSTSGITDLGWAGSLLEISHTSVFGNFQETSRENWQNVVSEMNRQLEIEKARTEKQELTH